MEIKQENHISVQQLLMKDGVIQQVFNILSKEVSGATAIGLIDIILDNNIIFVKTSI